MKKLKMKKSVKNSTFIVVALLLFLSIGLYSGIKIYKQKEYEKTSEYKLLQIGYTEEETKTILDKYKNEEIDYILTKDLNNIYLTILNDKYFIYDNFYEYLEYYQNNLDKPIRNIVEVINTKTNNEYYTETEDTDISKKELLIANKYYYLGKEYEPETLVTIPTTYAWGDLGNQKTTQETYDAYLNMWNGASNEGFYLMVSSSYRNYDEQESVYNNYKKRYGEEYADGIAARPGFSEHQTGYALDIFEKTSTNQKTFHESTAYEWLKNNSYKYGFILRYPEDKENITGYSFESWHYRYVGIEVATYIYENNITFDEYYAYFLK